MAEIDFTKAPKGTDALLVSWLTIDGSDTGVPFATQSFNDNTATVTGTFDSNTLTMQGSNDGTNWFTLTDTAGNAATFTAAGAKLLTEAPAFIRPSLGAGASSDIDVLLLLRRV